MTDNDTWGRDPQIRYMRGVFAAIETAQKEFLQAVGVSSRDERLRRFREIALRFFERSWSSAMQRGIGADERSAAAIYIFCLARAVSMRGVVIPKDVLPEDAVLKKLVDEVLK